MMVDQKWGELIKKYMDYAPYGLICVRVGHESNGNPRCSHMNTGETGLLQVWCGGEFKKGLGPMSRLGLQCQKKLPGFDPFDPSQNLWGGLADLNMRGYQLKISPQGKLFPVSDFQFWGCLMVQMNIGDGALAALLNASNAREGQALTDLVEFVTQIGSGLEDYRARFGSQSAESVARRVLVVPYWIKAAEQIGAIESVNLTKFGYNKMPKFVA
jgi:hypothetical protein